ncbi:MAG: hypothetical protein OEY89_11165 [Gammaproteobacteria bacterium]|nr:hypothetical protein [Gammaproteobacteria bacterium]
MLMQQINLYQDTFKKTGVRVSAKQVMVAGAGLLLTLMCVAVIYYVQLAQLESRFEMAKAEQTEKYSKLDALQKQVQARSKNKILLNEIEVVTTDIAKKQKVMQILTSQKFGNTQGFSEHVKGLARQRVEGMWLTGLSISQGGEHLALTGLTHEAKLLPQYLQKLSSETVFLGKEFETLNISRNTANTNWLDFDLRSDSAKKSVAAEHAASRNKQP